MDISRRNHTKKENKENTEPAHGRKPPNTRNGSSDTVSSAPHHKRSETQSVKRGDSTQGDVQLMKTLKHVKAMPAGKANSRQTLSKAFLTEQAVKQNKIIEAAKPPVPQPHTKPAPGLYKGKVVQSKIGSIWKSSVVAKEGDQKPKPSTARVQSQRVDNFTKMRSRSVADLPGRVDHKPKSTRSDSVSSGPLPKRPVAGRPPTGLQSARHPPRTTRPAAPSSARMGAVAKGTEVVRDKKVDKPLVSSSLSQYRVPMESAEERRAKLADWLASKGKTLKRPVMLATQPAKTKVPIKPHVEPKYAIQCDPKPESSQDPSATTTVVSVLSAKQPEETGRVEGPASDASSPLARNATRDLLDNSDLDLPVDPKARVDDIVVNLCEALSALATNKDEPQQKDQCDDCEMANEDEKQEMPERVADDKKEEEEAEVKEDVETESNSEEQDYCKEYEIDDDEEEEGDDETKQTSTVEDASSVKYNVKTTPYLQSVTKGLQSEARSACTGSRRKPDIKDLKFLTPVRRSSRIHRNSSRLPPMVLDHDPCVTSLAELVQLDGSNDDTNAYIYRKNPALLEDAQDPKKELLNDSNYF